MSASSRRIAALEEEVRTGEKQLLALVLALGGTAVVPPEAASAAYERDDVTILHTADEKGYSTLQAVVVKPTGVLNADGSPGAVVTPVSFFPGQPIDTKNRHTCSRCIQDFDPDDLLTLMEPGEGPRLICKSCLGGGDA